MKDCCEMWNDNEVIDETPLMRAVVDGFPVVPGHALIYPRRHVDRFVDLTTEELYEFGRLVASVQDASDATNFTIAINDGPLAGRTVHHLHVHVIPRRNGDMADPRGGVRRMFIPATAEDPWITK